MTAADRSALLLPFATLGALLMVGLVVGDALLGTKLRDFKRADRYVEVKGLVERTVKSDSVTWPLSFSDAADDLPTAYAASEREKAVILAFLSRYGFRTLDISVDGVSVTDRSAQQFNNNSKGPRFIVQQTVTVQSGDVDKVAAVSGKVGELIQSGVVLGSGQSPTYTFNGLNALKPDMITEATRNARAAADRFAADSGSRVGSIRSANQGVFSISAAGAGAAPDEGGGTGAFQPADSSLMKKVRVVTTVDYYLMN